MLAVVCLQKMYLLYFQVVFTSIYRDVSITNRVCFFIKDRIGLEAYVSESIKPGLVRTYYCIRVQTLHSTLARPIDIIHKLGTL
jgi:hypothetical protein